MSFKYSNTDNRLILRKIDLKIESGQKIGIVGRNGAGKTTLVKMLVNLYPEFLGNIYFNDSVDIASIPLNQLRRKVFLFPQEVYIFSGSIRENILYANPNATNDQVVRACELANFHDFVKTLHLGYNHKVGDDGANLSGGERLKLAFARLFISNPDVIILDEASSELDVETEQKILRNVMLEFKDKIVISIAHRINTLCQSDKIIVMDKGEIVEMGSHNELTKEKGLYHQFINTYVDN